MAKSISSWIQKTCLECLSADEIHNVDKIGKSKVVQVIKGFDDDLNILIVSDSINTISICLTKDVIDDFKKKNPRATLSSLKGSIIKMEKCCMKLGT